jgi:hypothetical protein
MKIYDLLDKEGRVFAFEVNNFFLSRKRLSKIVNRMPGVRMIRTPRRFSWEDEFCEFEIDGQRFTAWEPWGDSNRFWIGPKSNEWCPQVEIVKHFFLKKKTPVDIIKNFFFRKKPEGSG